MIVHGFLAALSALTIFRFPAARSSTNSSGLIYYPLIGLLFGLSAFITLNCLALRLPYLSAYSVIAIWCFFSGMRHTSEAAAFLAAAAKSLSTEQRRQELDSPTKDEMAATVAVVLILGKVLAVIQLQALDIGSAAFTLLLVPVISRYVAVLFGLGGEVTKEFHHIPKKTPIVIGTSLITLALCFLSVALSLALLVTALIGAMLIAWIARARFGSDTREVLSAGIEVSEVVMLWVPAVCLGLGLNLFALAHY